MQIKEKFSIVGMTCTNCSNAIEKAVKKIDGVKSVSVNFSTSSAEICIENGEILEKIVSKIKKLGYDIATNYDELEAKKQKNLNNLRWRFILAVVLCGMIMFIEMSGHFSFIFRVISEIILTGVVLFYCGSNFFVHAYISLKEHNYDMNVLVSLGSLSAYLYSLYVAVFYMYVKSEFLLLYFDSAAMIISFILLGKYLEERSKMKANSYIKSLVDMSPKVAFLVQSNGNTKEILASELKINDIVIVKNGQAIPCDGVIIEGGAEIDTSLINGESLPIYKSKGDSVNAGCINTNGVFHVKVEKNQNKTLLAGILNLLSEASGKKMPISRFADKVANIFVPSIITISLVTFLVWFFSGNFYYGIMCAICVLIISCPCALGLATPTAIVCAISSSAKNGILIKNPEVLEILKDVKTIVFDKTGTLSKGKISVFKTDILTQDFKKIASAQMLSEHLISSAIVQYAQKYSPNLTKFQGEFQSVVGKGTIANDENYNIIVGNMDFLLENRVKFELCDEARGYLDQGFGLIFTAINGVYKGYIALSDEIKDDAKQTIKTLTEMGISTVMLTGDNVKTANFIASNLGIDKVYAEVLPTQKYDIIKSLKNNAKILFVGDGVNDAPSLKAADIGIAMNSGSDISKEAGDIIFIRNRLSSIIFALKLSQKTMMTIKQNLFWAFIYNIICIPVAAGVLYPIWGIILQPMYGAAAMCFSSVSVVLNSLRLRFFNP